MSRIVVAVMSVAGLVLPAGAHAWVPPQKISPGATFRGGGEASVGESVYPTPDGRLAAFSSSGTSIAAAGAPFPTPTPLSPAPDGSYPIKAVFAPDGSATLAYESSTSITIVNRAADGTLSAPVAQYASSQGFDLRSDGQGGVIGIFAVDTGGNSSDIHVIARPAGASSFSNTVVGPSEFTSSWPSLVVDPDGTIVAVWASYNSAGSAGYIRQAVRPAGQASFNGPTSVYTGGAQTLSVPDGSQMPVVAQNAVGRAVAVFYDVTTANWSAVLRNPGTGGFATPVTLNATPEPQSAGVSNPPSAVAVSGDGTVGVATERFLSESCGGSGIDVLYAGISTYRAGAGSSTWQHLGSYGGVVGDSEGDPALAGGPGSRIDAAWWRDNGKLTDLCSNPGTRGIDLLAGDLSGPTPIYSYTLPQSTSTSVAPYNHAIASHISMTLDACGTGAMEFGVNPAPAFYNADTSVNGTFVSTTGVGPCGSTSAVKPANTSAPTVAGGTQPGQTPTCNPGNWSGTAPITYTYAWLRDASNIAAASNSTYRLTPADSGHAVACRVTATNVAGTASATSASLRVARLSGHLTVAGMRVRRRSLQVTLRCTGANGLQCSVVLVLRVVEKLRGGKVIAVSAAAKHKQIMSRTVTVGTAANTLGAGQKKTMTVSLNRTGQVLLTARHRLPVRLDVGPRHVGPLA